MAITVNAVHRRVQYTSSGSLGPYSFAFKVLASADIRVYVGSTQKTVTTHYTTSLSADGTGSVTFTSGNAPASSTIVTIESNQAIERTSDYTTGGDFKAASINDDLDSLAINDQQLETVQSRNIQLATTVNRTTSGSGTSGPLYFPYDDTVANNASKVVSFDAAGTALIATQELGELQGNWAASTAYVLRDIVKDTSNNNIYICIVAHTSSGSQPISSNTDAAKWSLIVDAASATTSAAAAATSATAAATSATASATSATASASSATGAASSASTASTQASNASTSATAAAASNTAAANSVSAVGLQFTFDNSTTMADPGTGDFRLNHGTIASVSAIALDATSADTGNPDVSDFIATWDDSTSTLNGHLILKKKGTPATFAIFTVGAVTDNTGWLQVALTHVDSNGSWSASDVGYLQFIRLGDKGDTGSTGSQGAKGDAPGVLMAWETATADSDQGAGKIWGNNGTVSSISILYVDDVEAGGASINSFVDTWDDSTNSNPKGHIYIVKNSAPENFHLFAVTSTVVSASTYSKVPVSFIQTSGTISDGDACSVLWVRTGDKGADGSGTMSSFTMSDGSTTQSITDGQTQVFAAGEGLDVAVSATDTVTYSGEDASTSNKGVASFSSDNFAVSSGAVTIKDGGVVTAEIADNAVTLAKMASGTDGTVLTFDASGNPTAVGPGSDGQVLTSTGAGSPPAFEDAAGGASEINELSDAKTITISGNATSVALGSGALATQNASYGNNTALGYRALNANTTSQHNVSVGTDSLLANTTGGENTAVGADALKDNNGAGAGNTAVGYQVLLQNDTASNNSGYGYRSLYSNTTGADNTGYGRFALYNNTTGSNNTGIGHGAGSLWPNGTTTGSNNTSLGHDASPSANDSDNQVTLGNSSVASIRCQVQSISALSDRRDKKDIQELPIGLDFINDLKPVKFVWNMRDGAKIGIQEVGFVAQELDECQINFNAEEYLNLVLKENPDKLEATYGKLVPVLVKAVQELSVEVNHLKEKLNK